MTDGATGCATGRAIDHATRRVERVVIVGRDAAAWLTALGLQRAVGGTGVSVEVVELPSLLHAADVYSAVPSLAGLHRLLGLDEALPDACSGVPVGGQRFAGWSPPHPDFIHAYDTQRMAFDDLDFLQFWIRARGEGLRVAYEDFSPAASAAKQGRMGGEAGMLAPLARGFHLDAPAYVRSVRAHALRSGVGHIAAGLAAVERDGTCIRSVTTDDGRTIAGDLFIDASGAEAALIGASPGGVWESWGAWLGVDRVLATSAPVLRPLPAFAQISAFRAGWVGLFPLADRTGVVAAYDSERVSDDEMARIATSMSGLRPGGEAVTTPFAAGMRRSWIGNTVAIGEAAVACEPLDAVQLHVVHVGISNLVGLFPATADRMPEADAFSAAVASHARGVRDFQIAHYRLNGRMGEPFWDRARDGEGPSSLHAKLALFASRGLVALYDDEAFQEQNWAAILIGHGLIPRSYDPLVDKVPPDEQIDRMRGLLGTIAQEVRAMPTVEAHLAGATQSPSPR